MTFKFAGARAQVCKYCKSVVARSGAGLQAQGKMAELLEIPTPLQYGASGSWGGEQFIVEGRLQMDRAGAPGAPWQESMLSFPMSDRYSWVAYAQGRWYATSETEPPQSGLPPADSLKPGSQVNLGSHGVWTVGEIGQRRVIAGEGELPNVPTPGVVTRYADISSQGGKYGTIDYGDGSAAATLYLGRQFDPGEIKLDSGMPLEMPAAEVSAVECPNCGAELPLLSQQSLRVVCQYCGTASDVSQGKLAALGRAPPPPIQPYIPLGAKGTLHGHEMIVCGFMIRSCLVEGVRYSWREYLLFAGEAAGYRWLMEEDGNWFFVDPIEAGEIVDSGNAAMLRGVHYNFKQQVEAVVDYVIGEFYWKVEIGETVDSTEFEGPGGKLSRERTSTEVNYSFVTPLDPQQLAVFGVAPPPGGTGAAPGGGSGDGSSSFVGTIVIIVFICIFLAVVMGDCGGRRGGSRGGGIYYGGGSGWSK
jgi:ribosomal protein S27E